MMKNLVNELFTNANYPEQGDFKNHIIKTLNKILEDGYFSIQIAEKGKTWKNKNKVDINGKSMQYNIVIRGYGHRGRYYVSNSVSPMNILQCIYKFISIPEVADNHIKSMTMQMHELHKCDRCMGIGYIYKFNHVCDGICFDCYGTKYKVIKKTITL